MNEKLKARLKAIAPKVGFPLFYLFCLVLFARWTFPYDKLRDRIVTSFNEQQRATGGTQELKIDEMGSAFGILAIKASGVHLLSPAAEAGKAPTELKIDDARASVGLFSAMFGTTSVSFRVDAFGGTVKGDYSDSSKERKIDVDLDSVSLSQIEPVGAALGVPVDGAIDGSIQLTMPEGKASKATGTLTIDAKDVAVGDGKAKIKGLLALPKVSVGALAIAGEAKEGVLKITKLAASGKDVDLSGDGRIQLRDTVGESIADVNLRFKISDAYKGKSDTTKSLFGAPGSTIPGAMDLDPTMKQAKRADGSYAFHMRGQLAKPAFDAAPNVGGAPGAPRVP